MNELKTECNGDCFPHVTNTKQDSQRRQNSQGDSLQGINRLHSTQHVRIRCMLYKTMLKPPSSIYHNIFNTTQIISAENMTCFSLDTVSPGRDMNRDLRSTKQRCFRYTAMFDEKWINTLDNKSREERKNTVPQTQFQPPYSAHFAWPQESEGGRRDLNRGWIHSTL
jgi:hypothetical protein